MEIKKGNYLLFCLLFLSLGMTNCGQAQENTKQQKRKNVNANVQEKRVDLFLRLKLSESFHTRKARAREFIWEHWTLRKKGKLKLEAYSKEREKSISVYEIKIQQGGKPFLKVSIEREYTDKRKPSNSNSKFKVFRNYSVYKIDRIRLPKDGLEKKIVISPKSNVSAKSYLLRLKTISGEVISRI